MSLEIPDPEALKAILSAPGAAPRITLDLDGSDTPLTGWAHVSLDGDGELVVEAL